MTGKIPQSLKDEVESIRQTRIQPYMSYWTKEQRDMWDYAVDQVAFHNRASDKVAAILRQHGLRFGAWLFREAVIQKRAERAK